MGNGSCVAITIGALVIAGIILTIGLVATSLKRLNSDEVGLHYNTFTKKLSKDPFYEGLHLGSPGFQFIKFPSVFRSLEYSNVRCLNLDGVSISLDIGFQYRVRPQNLYSIVMQFKDESGYLKILRSIGLSSIFDICSLYNTTQFQSDRGKFQDDLYNRIEEKYRAVNCDVTDLQVNNIQRPSQYESAIRNKEAAREDIVVARSERPRKLTEARTVLREAETQSEIIIDKAHSDSRIMLTQANNEAFGILNDFKQEAATYKNLVSQEGIGLNTEGLLAYLGVRALSNAHHPVQVGLQAPARSSYRDSLVVN